MRCWGASDDADRPFHQWSVWSLDRLGDFGFRLDHRGNPGDPIRDSPGQIVADRTDRSPKGRFDGTFT